MFDVASHTFTLTKYYFGMFDGTSAMIALSAKTLNPRILRSDDHNLLFDLTGQLGLLSGVQILSTVCPRRKKVGQVYLFGTI